MSEAQQKNYEQAELWNGRSGSARAAEPLLSNLPTPDAGAPGQFAFADGGRVRRILEASDWKKIDVRPIDVRNI
jgi:hypothetical protein